MDDGHAIRCPQCHGQAMEQAVGQIVVVTCECVKRGDIFLIYGPNNEIKGQIINIEDSNTDGR